MNRYRANGPSQATANTLCQKCLKRGHYSYECTASLQDRRYVSRPSRTQQLLNPRLAPKITEAAPKIEEAKLQTASKSDVSRKKREEDDSELPSPKRSRSVSSYSSDSVSTISTNRSRSASRSPPNRRGSDSTEVKREFSSSGNVSGKRANDSKPTTSDNRRGDQAYRDRREGNARNETRKRRRSGSSEISPRPSGRSFDQDDTRSRSPAVQTRGKMRSRSRSPFRRTQPDISRKSDTNKGLEEPSSNRSQRRERSMSPYSKRLALTQAKDRD